MWTGKAPIGLERYRRRESKVNPHRPSCLHMFGKTIDMSIEWNGTLKIKQKNGAKKTIGSLPRTGLNHDLWVVGATCGVLKLPSDVPHWSNTGH
jgi:hypothetical protein